MKLRVELIPAFLLIYTAFAFARTGNQVIRQECLIVAELESGKVVFKNDAGLCGSRIYAASTFKIPLALMAFDTGVITDSETMLKWDGTNQPIKSHERDHNAKTWLRDSVVWFSKRLTPQIGQSKIAAYLNDFQYGNKDFSGGLERAWLNSTLKISPLEQIDFLRRLKRRELKVEPKTIDSVLAILPVETDRLGFKVVGKTGSDSSWDDESLRNGPQFRVGWYVGYLEANSRQYVFASALKAASEDRTFVYSGREAKELALSALKSVSLASKVTQDFSRKSWLKDFQQLKQIISNTYPNLDSIVEVEKLDLPGLSRKREQAFFS
ncbi:hypothetical protein K2X30_12560 [bacterium]|nr:hypothetical protein [bacterium]